MFVSTQFTRSLVARVWGAFAGRERESPPCVLHFRVFLYIFCSSCLCPHSSQGAFAESPPCVLHGSEQTQCWQCKRAIDAPGSADTSFRNRKKTKFRFFVNVWNYVAIFSRNSWPIFIIYNTTNLKKKKQFTEPKVPTLHWTKVLLYVMVDFKRNLGKLS